MDIRYINGSLLFSDDSTTLAQTLTNAVKAGTDLSGAYLSGANLSGANLSNANLSYADLSGANLSGANLRSANLSGANLSGANLSYAYLSYAYLSGADLRSANLSGANLSGADLSGAILSGADLRSADLSDAYLSYAYLSGANLSGANLSGANLSEVMGLHWQVCPQEGSFICYKAVSGLASESRVLKLRVPEHAERITALSSRKCRTNMVEVLSAHDLHGNRISETEFRSRHDHHFFYTVGKTVEEKSFDPDPRIECSGGIHFFMTFVEAVEWVQANVRQTLTVCKKVG